MQPSMPRPSTSTFMNFEDVDVVLVPFDDLPVLHRGRLDRHEIVEAVLRQHEAAGMLREMPRRADQLAREFQGQAQAAVVEVEVELLDLPLARRRRVLQPQTRPASAAVTSSGTPSALPTSRTAPRAR